MITRDFILREIQQLVAVLARVFLLRGTGQKQEILNEISLGLTNCDLGAALRDELPREDLISLCTSSAGFSFEKALALADLLRERGYTEKELNRGSWCYSMLHALWLYEHISSLPNSIRPLDIGERILALRQELATLPNQDNAIANG
jgi:hypothetical protein